MKSEEVIGQEALTRTNRMNWLDWQSRCHWAYAL